MVLRLEGVSKRFAHRMALRDVSCDLAASGIIGLVGPNGAGKSTLLRILATLVKPSAGEVVLDGESIVRHPDRMRAVLGYLPQEVPCFRSLSANEYLRYLAAAKGLGRMAARRQIDDLLERFELARAERRALAEFSRGMRQRVGLAAALLGDPRIIIVDEPSTGLDPRERVNLRILLSELGEKRLVLLSTHTVSDIEAVSSRLLLLSAGVLIYDGSPQTLLAEAQGKVWERTYPVGRALRPGAMISGLVHAADGVLVREVSAVPPAADALRVTPTLEDACLLALGKEDDHAAAHHG